MASEIAGQPHWEVSFDEHGKANQGEVDTLLAKDLARFEPAVRKAFSGKGALKATHNRFNAALSLAFNIGAAGFASSTVYRRRPPTGAGSSPSASPSRTPIIDSMKLLL